jgi:N-succinyldiaminopimelate aminotransferase
MKKFLLYRTYHGSAMSTVVQRVSMAAWADEAHVAANRELYRQKFARVTPMLAEVMDVRLPDAGFYLWCALPPSASGGPGDDVAAALSLLAQYNVAVLPGSFLARDAHGLNPGAGRLRLALVAGVDECVEAASRIVLHFRATSPSSSKAPA